MADPSETRRGNRWLGTAVVAIMILLAITSLMVGLKTVPSRRARDPKEPLGYFPGDTNVIGAVHISKLMTDVTGRRFLEKFVFGPAESGLQQIEEWTGLRREEIDYLVVGLKVDDRLIPRVVLVVQTTRPYDEAMLVQKLPDREHLQRGEKAIYRFTMGKGPLSGALWCAGANTVVVALRADDLENVPTLPRTGWSHLAMPLQDFIQNRMPADTEAWLVGHSEHWKNTVAWPLLLHLAGTEPKVLASVQTAGAALGFNDDVVVHGSFQCSDDQSAHSLATAFEKHNKSTGLKDGWISLTNQTDPEAIRDRLGEAFKAVFSLGGKVRP